MLIKFVKDLCVLSIAATGTIIGITLASSGLPADIEARTLYPILAKPVARWQYVVGKYLGALGAVALGMAIMLAAFCCILFLFTGHIDTGVFLVTPFLLIEVGIVTAIALALSTVCSPPARLVFVPRLLPPRQCKILDLCPQSRAGRMACSETRLWLRRRRSSRTWNASTSRIPSSTAFQCPLPTYGRRRYTALRSRLSSCQLPRSRSPGVSYSHGKASIATSKPIPAPAHCIRIRRGQSQ